jgi:hypothetical protein
MDFRFSGSGIVFRDAAHEDRLKSSGGVLVDLLVKLIVDLFPNNDDVRHGHPPRLSCSDWGESFLLVAEILAQPCHVCARASHFAFLGRRLKKSLGRALGGGRCSGERLRGISDRVGTFALLRFQAPVLVDWEERPTGPRALAQQVSETTSAERVPVAHRLEQSKNRGAIAAIALGLIEGSVGDGEKLLFADFGGDRRNSDAGGDGKHDLAEAAGLLASLEAEVTSLMAAVRRDVRGESARAR